MATASATSDVFITHNSSQREFATEIAHALHAAGLEPFYDARLGSGDDIGTAIWEALAECHALIAIISAADSPDAMGMVEIGAAIAWNKPIYLILDGPSTTRLPPVLQQFQVFPRNRVDEVIQKILAGFEPFTTQDRQLLEQIYKGFKVPVDKLALSSVLQAKLTKQFNQQSQKNCPSERLISELFKLRKQGSLPRFHR